MLGRLTCGIELVLPHTVDRCLLPRPPARTSYMFYSPLIVHVLAVGKWECRGQVWSV
jgi:hypothetical protein